MTVAFTPACSVTRRISRSSRFPSSAGDARQSQANVTTVRLAVWSRSASAKVEYTSMKPSAHRTALAFTGCSSGRHQVGLNGWGSYSATVPDRNRSDPHAVDDVVLLSIWPDDSVFTSARSPNGGFHAVASVAVPGQRFVVVDSDAPHPRSDATRPGRNTIGARAGS